MHIVWEGCDYRDRIDIDPESFYARLVTAREMPTTSQPSLPELVNAYEQAARKPRIAVFILTLSSKLSGVYNAAYQAAKLVDFPVHVIDTRPARLRPGWPPWGWPMLATPGSTSRTPWCWPASWCSAPK
jgi:DegV family protein with EDD domain